MEPICLCPPPHTHHPVGGDHSPTFTRLPASGRTLQEGRGSGEPRLGSKSPWGCLAAIQNVRKGPSPSLTAALGWEPRLNQLMWLQGGGREDEAGEMTGQEHPQD